MSVAMRSNRKLLVGAAALLGVASAPALAADPNNDPPGALNPPFPRYLAVRNSTIRISIAELLANDQPPGATFVRARKTPGNLASGGQNSQGHRCRVDVRA